MTKFKLWLRNHTKLVSVLLILIVILAFSLWWFGEELARTLPDQQ